MNGEVGNGKEEIDVEENTESSDESEDTMLSEDIADVDNVGDISVEINVEELVAKLEAGEGDVAAHKKAIRQRLDELEEQRRMEEELKGTYSFNIDDDL